MLILPQIVELKWNSRNKSFYQNKNCVFTKMGDSFKIYVLDLKETENIKVNLICDYCNEEIEKKYCNHIGSMNHSTVKKDCCKKCHIRKIEESNILKYGVTNAFQREDIKEKIQTKSLEKYGTINPQQSRVANEKRKQTNLEKYGVEYQISSKQTREKIKNINLDKYGNEIVFYNKEIQEKIKKTNLTKYGVENPTQNKEIAKKVWIKARRTMFESGTAPTSNQQIYLHKLLGGYLNYPVDLLHLDIAYLSEMIYIEYDGGAHGYAYKCGFITKKEFDKKENRRNYLLKRLGWKRIRLISSKDDLPLDKIIIKLISEAKEYLKTGHSWYEININESKIKCSQFEKEIELGFLRKISKIDILDDDVEE